MKCELCGMDNLAPDHWMSVIHLDNQIKAERIKLEELNKDK